MFNRRKNKLDLLIVIFQFIFSSVSFAQVGGSSTYQFLALPFSARDAALGGNMISVKDNDINLALNNPALITPKMSNTLAINFANYIADINYGSIAYSKTFTKAGSFLANMQYYNYGSFTEADETGLITGNFSAADYALNIGYVRPITVDSVFTVGATLKTIYSNLGPYNSLGSAVDIGATYVNEEHLLTASVVVKNIGRQWKSYTDGITEPLPFNIQVAVSKKLQKAPFRFTILGHTLQKWDLTYEDPANPSETKDPITGELIKRNQYVVFFDKLGRHLIINVEALLGKNFALRLGYNFQRKQEMVIDGRVGLPGFSFGLGFKINKFSFSYARSQYHVAGGTNTFSITTNLSDFYSKQKK